nr:MAG TPA: hypothetical protein [Caudoviricetes sp.]
MKKLKILKRIFNFVLCIVMVITVNISNFKGGIVYEEIEDIKEDI